MAGTGKLEQPPCHRRHHRCGAQPGIGRQYQEQLHGKKVMEYQAKEESLTRQVENEQKRAAELEERRVYVQTKQYIEEVAKQKLGLVKPDEVLLKPRPKNN